MTRQGDRITIHNLLRGLMLPSGNDAAFALAEFFGDLLIGQNTLRKFETWGKRMEEAMLTFLGMMNSNAKKFNMNSTFYANPHGLVNNRNKSTAYDLGLLCLIAMENPQFREIVSTKEFSFDIKD